MGTVKRFLNRWKMPRYRTENLEDIINPTDKYLLDAPPGTFVEYVKDNGNGTADFAIYEKMNDGTFKELV